MRRPLCHSERRVRAVLTARPDANEESLRIAPIAEGSLLRTPAPQPTRFFFSNYKLQTRVKPYSTHAYEKHRGMGAPPVIVTLPQMHVTG